MRNEYVLIGTDAPFADVEAGVGAALEVLFERLNDDLRSARIGPTARIWLDPEELGLLEDPSTPEYDGVRFAIKVYDSASPDPQGSYATQEATAAKVYDALVAASGWHLVLVRGEWGPTLATRPAEVAAA